MLSGLFLLLATAGSTIDDGWPPRGHYRRDASAHVHFVDQEHITAFCDAGEPDDPDYYTVACQSGFRLYLPNPCTYGDSDEYARIVCHELGHLNGWPDNHPGARRHK